MRSIVSDGLGAHFPTKNISVVNVNRQNSEVQGIP